MVSSNVGSTKIQLEIKRLKMMKLILLVMTKNIFLVVIFVEWI